MSCNETYIEFITPKLKEFWSKHKDDYINSHIPNGLFLPHAFESYDNAQLKVFYIGQDVPYWLPSKEMADLFNAERYDEYIRKNNNVLADRETRLAWGNNSGAFWSMVMKLHLLINTGKWMNLTELGSKYNTLIQSMGYSNVNSIAVARTLRIYNNEVDIDYSKYSVIRDDLLQIERLKYIIDVYEPDIIIILCGHLSMYLEDNYFADINIKWTVDEKLEQYIVTGETLTPKKGKIIWCPNPSAYRFLGTNMREMAELIKNNIH